ncbi:MAG TPA: 50S ribosomal protein L4 [Candidatus Limnocylindrales bacterium]|nr:50S ribosomal protein L4 [Candidatus Limnocylindrales bacterium]
MAVVDVRNLEGKTVGQMELADDVFAARVNPHVLHETVRHYLASQRAGTHKTKAKGEVSGAGRKLWKQKGTGRARIGSIRSPLWRHGGTVHGPVPRKYGYRLPRKMFLGALRSALSAKLADNKLFVVENWQLDSHKTKPFRQALTKLDEASRTLLLVDAVENVNLERASRNIEGVKLVRSMSIQPYDLLRHEALVLSREAAEKLSRGLSEMEAPDGDSRPVQIEPARPGEPAAKREKPEHAAKHAAKSEHAKHKAKPAAKSHAKKAKAKPAAKKHAKAKPARASEPKAKKDKD